MQKRKYTEEMRLFVIENGKGCSSSDLTRLFNERFGTDFKESQITALRYSLGAKSGIDTRFKSGDETGAEYRFKKGQQCRIKGRKWDEWMPKESQERSKAGWFSKGHSPHNKVPVGTELVKADGYLWRKIAEPNRWKQVHILEWEKRNGRIPKGMCLTFLDGNRRNTDPGNLLLISRKENRIMNANWNSDRTDDAEMTKAHIGIRRIQDRISEIEKGSENGNAEHAARS